MLNDEQLAALEADAEVAQLRAENERLKKYDPAVRYVVTGPPISETRKQSVTADGRPNGRE
jgi:hypothetical protein